MTDTCPRCGGRLKQPSWGSPDPHGVEDCIRSLADRLGQRLKPVPDTPLCPSCGEELSQIKARTWTCTRHHPGDDE